MWTDQNLAPMQGRLESRDAAAQLEHTAYSLLIVRCDLAACVSNGCVGVFVCRSGPCERHHAIYDDFHNPGTRGPYLVSVAGRKCTAVTCTCWSAGWLLVLLGAAAVMLAICCPVCASIMSMRLPLRPTATSAGVPASRKQYSAITENVSWSFDCSPNGSAGAGWPDCLKYTRNQRTTAYQVSDQWLNSQCCKQLAACQIHPCGAYKRSLTSGRRV